MPTNNALLVETRDNCSAGYLCLWQERRPRLVLRPMPLIDTDPGRDFLWVLLESQSNGFSKSQPNWIDRRNVRKCRLGGR
jgi:hypothetical protein